MKSKKLISRNIILTKINFLQFLKMTKNQFLYWKKVYNYLKCNFTKKKNLDLFDFTSFFMPGLFFYIFWPPVKGDMNSKLTDVTNDMELYERRFRELENKINQMDEMERKNAQEMETKINEIEESFKVSLRGLVSDALV